MYTSPKEELRQALLNTCVINPEALPLLDSILAGTGGGSGGGTIIEEVDDDKGSSVVSRRTAAAIYEDYKTGKNIVFHVHGSSAIFAKEMYVSLVGINEATNGNLDIQVGNTNQFTMYYINDDGYIAFYDVD